VVSRIPRISVAGARVAWSNAPDLEEQQAIRLLKSPEILRESQRI